MKETIGEIGKVICSIVDTASSDEMRGTLKMMRNELYGRLRWGLASVLHPIATLKTVALIGTSDSLERDAKRALALPFSKVT